MKFYVESWQCKQVLLACCYDSGYSAFLGQYAAESRFSDRITLVEGGFKMSRLKSTGLKSIRLGDIFTTTEVVERPKSISSTKFPNARPERLGPIQLDTQGKRVDRPLSVRAEVVRQFEKMNLCYGWFLRGECHQVCYRKHSDQQLNDEEWDALWLVARRGRCYENQKNKICDNNRCIYGHF